MYAMIEEGVEIKKDRTFEDYHNANPHIYALFLRYTFELIAAGRKHYGAKGVMERIRFHTAICSDEVLKVNNNYTAGYARMFAKQYPQHKDFFKTRKLTSNRNK
ncbi:MAG: hypothetical protein MI745_14180 [Pseudomonadales bacterium]|nr:hypothetical protein [Pseudomonadales bacterium]